MDGQNEDVPLNEGNQPLESIINVPRISLPLSLDGTRAGIQPPIFHAGIRDFLHLQNRSVLHVLHQFSFIESSRYEYIAST